MTRVALCCSEPIRAGMAGIGVRYLELARRIVGDAVEVVLLTRNEPREVPPLPSGVDVRPLRLGSVAADLRHCDGAVLQGGLADLVLREIGDLPVAVDLYDPWLVENLHYHRDLGTAAYRRDYRSWQAQLARGDFFLCSSEQQRCFYLGWLAAIGRLRPELLADDPTLRSLIDLVPFGIATELPEHRPLLPPRTPGERRILFGGVYDWLDPWPVLRALATVDDPAWRLLLVRSPNPETTPQRTWARVEAWCREREWWGERVVPIDWVDADRRFDLFRDVDALVVSHRDGPEALLSLRTRVLDALATGCPVVITDGGATAEAIRRFRAGVVVPPGDADALVRALHGVLSPTAGPPARAEPSAELLDAMGWERALEPLARFCRRPWRHPTRRLAPSSLGAAGRFRDALRRVRQQARSRAR